YYVIYVCCDPDQLLSIVTMIEVSFYLFFFSSRRRHTIFKCDWSSDVCSSDLSVLEDCGKIFGFQITSTEFPFGGNAIDKTGRPLPQETLDACLKADAVLLGAVGGPRWDSQPLDRRPEAGLLALRRELGVYANVRPIRLREPLRSLSP